MLFRQHKISYHFYSVDRLGASILLLNFVWNYSETIISVGCSLVIEASCASCGSSIVL